MKERTSYSLNRLNTRTRKAVFVLILAAVAVLAFTASAQTNLSRPASIPGRYLFIVETSHPMNRRSDGVIRTVATLLLSGMSGQIRQGDTIGIWTYNQQLYTGRLPLQHWSTAEERDAPSAILNYLKAQKYEKESAFSSVRPALEKVVKDSESITVILVSSGDEPVAGTPFDDQINQLYKNWHEEQQKSRMPFVTVLRAKRGTIVGYSVTPSPWQVEIPAWPAEPAVAKAARETNSAPPPKVQPSTVPPLFFTGRKPKPDTTNSSEMVATTPESAPPPAPKPTTNAPSGSAASDPSPLAASQKPPANSASEVTVLERKIERPQETPQHPPEPALTRPKDAIVNNPGPRGETVSPSAANRLNPSNPAPAEIGQKPTPAPQDVSTGVATPGKGLFSSKIIWIAGLSVLGVVCVVFIMIARRPRPGHISLITRSLEREKND